MKVYCFSRVPILFKTFFHRLIQASLKELFQFTYRWLILTYTKEQSQLSQLQNSPVLADSDLVVAERNGNQFQMVESK